MTDGQALDNSGSTWTCPGCGAVVLPEEAHACGAFGVIQGHTCPSCYAWVPAGQVHTCVQTFQAAPPWERIARALERIADALEKRKR
jgi:hypothetical protein